MKPRTILSGPVLILLSFVIAIPVQAQKTDPDFQQAVAAYQQSPSRDAAEKVIRLAVAMDQLPPIPEEARRHFVRGTTLFRDAKSPDDYQQVLDEFGQAASLAPWWPEARYNFALALEAAGDYDKAIANIRLYLLFKLPETDARSAQDKIYALEAKQEKAAKAKVEESSPQSVAAREQKSFEDLLKTIDGRKYATISQFIGEIVMYVRGRTFYYPRTGGHVEIQGREFTVPDYTPHPASSTSWMVSTTYSISEDGDKITASVRYSDGNVANIIWLWQR